MQCFRKIKTLLFGVVQLSIPSRSQHSSSVWSPFSSFTGIQERVGGGLYTTLFLFSPLLYFHPCLPSLLFLFFPDYSLLPIVHVLSLSIFFLSRETMTGGGEGIVGERTVRVSH